MNTRLENLANIALIPLRVVGALLAGVYMVLTFPLLYPCLLVLLVPASVAWALAPFVGLAWPPAGAAMCAYTDWCSDAFEACIDFLWAPLDWLMR